MSTTEQSVAVNVPEIEQPPNVVRFASKGRHLVIIRIASRTRIGQDGSKYFTEPVEYEFQEGFLNVYPGKDKLADKFNPATGDFEEQDVLEFLRSHILYGREDGFWEVAAVAPDPAPLQKSIMQLAVAAGNPATREDAEDKLVEIYEREMETWKRQPVLDGCKVALTAIESHRVPEAPAAPTTGEPWLGSGAKERPDGPPGFSRDEEGRLRPDNPEMIAASAPRKPEGMQISGAPRPFSPDSAPARED